MPFDFKSIPKRTVDVEYEFRGQTLTAVINPDKITEDVASRNEFAAALFAVMESWSAEDKLTLAFLRGLPMEFLVGLWSACQVAAFPKVKTAEQ